MYKIPFIVSFSQQWSYIHLTNNYSPKGKGETIDLRHRTICLAGQPLRRECSKEHEERAFEKKWPHVLDWSPRPAGDPLALVLQTCSSRMLSPPPNTHLGFKKLK